MITDTVAIRTYFGKLGLEPEIADLYLALHSYGPQTISELSRNSHVERTRVYRLIDTLLATNLIEIEAHNKRGIMKAAPIANLNILISQKEQELQSLQDELGLIEQVLARNSLSSPASRVQFYQGAEGVKQMLWNETKASTEILGILYENVETKTGQKFFERWVQKCNQSGLHFRGIFGDEFIKSQQSWYKLHTNAGLKNWESRHIAQNILPVTHTTIVYDNVVAYLNWHEEEVFGIEIYNKDIAAAQRVTFEMLWGQATEPVISKT
jgi:hypothetical protein